jgi:(p)ppGpp synthase/HD superfamily hydrolase
MKLQEKALAFAIEAHKGQRRKYTNEDYIVHPIAVAEMVRDVGGTDEMIVAAYLHDVVEDCEVDFIDLLDEFGPIVAVIVDELSDISIPEDGNREARKAIDRSWLSCAQPNSKTIKLADLIDNTKSIVQHDSEFAKVYMAEKKLLLEVLKEGNQELYRIADEIVKDYYANEN